MKTRIFLGTESVFDSSVFLVEQKTLDTVRFFEKIIDWGSPNRLK